MSFIRYFIVVLVLALAIFINYYLENEREKTTKSIIEWANENKIQLDKDVVVTPFKIEFNKSEWDFLLEKLKTTRYFSPLNEKYVAKFEYGFNPEYAKELVEYWKKDFNWKDRVDHLNKFPHFKIKFRDEITIHFVRVITNKSSGKEPIPIMLIDGWPGSFFGFYKMIDYINDNYKDQSFDIVVPNIPGYGFSVPLDKPVDTIETAQLFDALMRHLHGENCKYFVHGEDWGSLIGTNLAQLFPSRVKGIHLSMPVNNDNLNPKRILYTISSFISPSILFTPKEIEMNLTSRSTLKNMFKVILKDMGYMHLQATKPDTLAHGLTDSPVGLLAYILEKYSSWTFDFETEISGVRTGGLEKLNKDDLLTIITIYWMSNTISSSVRFYKASLATLFTDKWPHRLMPDARLPQEVAVGVQYFNNELFLQPKKIIELRYPNLKRFDIVKNGGHFGAFENPKISASDFIEFINSL